MDVADRVIGCVLGLALGDALGAPFEFSRARDIPRPLPAFELPWMGRPPGATTDDTALARNLVRSLAARGGFDADDLVSRHLAWFRSRPPDVGNLTRLVLRRVDEGQPAPASAAAVWNERGPEISAGNGSVMYCAPLGAAHAGRPDRLEGLAPALSALTHHDDRCRTACLAVCHATAALVSGFPRGMALERALTAALDRPGGEELEFLVEAAGTSRPVDGPDQGFCLFAAALALQTLASEEGFVPALSRIVALGGDTDTNAAVAGAVLGAAVGAAALPPEWLGRLEDEASIRAEAEAMAPLALATDG